MSIVVDLIKKFHFSDKTGDKENTTLTRVFTTHN